MQRREIEIDALIRCKLRLAVAFDTGPPDASVGDHGEILIGSLNVLHAQVPVDCPDILRSDYLGEIEAAIQATEGAG